MKNRSFIACLEVRDYSLIVQFARFGVVGVVGFGIDVLVLYTALAMGLGLYSGRLVSYLVAATTTWAMNRAYTFRKGSNVSKTKQWVIFVLLNTLGGAINYGVYAGLVNGVVLFEYYPVFAVAVGSLSGMVVNFTLSRTYVFNE